MTHDGAPNLFAKTDARYNRHGRRESGHDGIESGAHRDGIRTASPRLRVNRTRGGNAP